MPENAATLIAIADAIVDRINGASLSVGIAAERAYVPVHGLRELVDPRVTVVPSELTMRMLSRRDDDFDYVFDVGVQQKVGGTTPDEIDPLMKVVEEVMDLFRSQPLDYVDADGDPHSASCTAAANSPVYDPAHLDEHRVFTSVLSLTFSEVRGR